MWLEAEGGVRLAADAFPPAGLGIPGRVPPVGTSGRKAAVSVEFSPEKTSQLEEREVSEPFRRVGLFQSPREVELQ